VCIDTRYVAKIYDPVFYPFEDRELPDTRVDVAAVADSEYSIEAAAYSELEGSPVQGSIMPEYYGSWTLNVITVIQNEQITRQVRMILIEYVPGVRMLDINPEDLTPEAREYIMTKVIEADYDLRRAGVRHDDLSPRNIVLSETPDSIEPELRVTLVDFGCSTVFALRYGRPLRWGLCNPLFTWSSASAWSTWGWLPPCTEDEIAKRWKVWGSGRDGKYAAVERDANSQLGIPLRPKAKCKVQRNR
jgi:serine/threonine protein kinase